MVARWFSAVTCLFHQRLRVRSPWASFILFALFFPFLRFPLAKQRVRVVGGKIARVFFWPNRAPMHHHHSALGDEQQFDPSRRTASSARTD